MSDKSNPIIDPANLVYKKPKLITDQTMHYCPGCTHGTVHDVLAEVIEELGIANDTIGISPVGCAVFAYNYIDIDWQEAAHGRAPAVATGIKRVLPKKHVFTYQGDGDLAAIGTNETIHTCNRGENIVIILVNNATYGMTGGQMAPTSLIGQKTITSPDGRSAEQTGYPLRITELVAQIEGTCYVTRQTAHTAIGVRKLKKALKKAFTKSHKGLGTAFVEVVGSCNSNWRMSPVDANNWMEENMFPLYKPGDLKDVEDVNLTKVSKEWKEMQTFISQNADKFKSDDTLKEEWSRLQETISKIAQK